MTGNPQKVLIVCGTRPEAIKLAPVIDEFKLHNNISTLVCVTAQHRHLMDQVLDVFDIKPDYDLNLMTADQGLATFMSRAIEALDGVFTRLKPDLVVVQGDTSTVLCAALAAFYLHIPIAHVEAGLRTGDIQSPWPEEANRVLTSKIVNLHFAPTQVSYENLLKEGICSSKIFVTGNTVVDALLMTINRLKTLDHVSLGMPSFLSALSDEDKIILVTGHRRENFGINMQNITRAIFELASFWPKIHFVYPVHPNPQVKDAIRKVSNEFGFGENLPSNIHFIEPLSYLPFVALMQRSFLILTDSGGIQEEAPSLNKPVLVTRETTERPEAVRAGTTRLVGSDTQNIVQEVSRLISEPAFYAKMAAASNPYGDGRAAHRIVEACLKFLQPMRY